MNVIPNFSKFILLCWFVGFITANIAVAQQEGAYTFSDGQIADYQPRLIELDASRLLLVKHSRFGFDSSWVNMVWLDHSWSVLNHREHRLTIPLTFLFDVIKVDGGFVMCGTLSGSAGNEFIMKTDTAGNILRIDLPDLPNNENIHSLVWRGGDRFSAFSSTPMTYPANYRIDGSLSDTTLYIRKLQPSTGHYYRMYDVFNDGLGKDIMGGFIYNTPQQANDAFIMQLDSTGVDWLKTYDFLNNDNEYVSDIIKLPNGNLFYVVQGYTTGAGIIDSYFGEVDGNGNHVWARKMEMPLNGILLTGAIVLDSGDILMYGSTSYYYGLMVRITPAGNLVWKRHFPNTSGIIILSHINKLLSGKIAMTGYAGGNSLLLVLDEDGNGCGFETDTSSVISTIMPNVLSPSLYTNTAVNFPLYTGTFSSRNLSHTKADLCLGTSLSFINNSVYPKIFPNPANEIITINLDLKPSQNITVTITDARSVVVYKQKITFDDEAVNLPVKSLNNGIYYITLEGHDFASTSKFAVIH